MKRTVFTRTPLRDSTVCGWKVNFDKLLGKTVRSASRGMLEQQQMLSNCPPLRVDVFNKSRAFVFLNMKCKPGPGANGSGHQSRGLCPRARLKISSKLMPSKYLKNSSLKGAKLWGYPMDPHFSVQIYLLNIIRLMDFPLSSTVWSDFFWAPASHWFVLSPSPSLPSSLRPLP